MNLNNNSMNGTSLQNHYKSNGPNNNSKLFAQSSISNEMMRKNVMNDILRCSIDAVESNFNINNSSKVGTHQKKKVMRGGSNKLNAPASYVNRSLDFGNLNNDFFTKAQSGLSMQHKNGQ